MKFPSTSAKIQPFKSTADNQITSRDFLPESSKSDPGSSTTIEKDNIGDGIKTLIYVSVEMNFKMVHVIQSRWFWLLTRLIKYCANLESV